MKQTADQLLVLLAIGVQTWHQRTLVPRATLRGVAERHVASGMAQWRMFVTCCYISMKIG